MLVLVQQQDMGPQVNLSWQNCVVFFAGLLVLDVGGRDEKDVDVIGRGGLEQTRTGARALLVHDQVPEIVDLENRNEKKKLGVKHEIDKSPRHSTYDGRVEVEVVVADRMHVVVHPRRVDYIHVEVLQRGRLG